MTDAQNSNHPKDLTAVDFENLKKTTDLVLIDFWAEWCGPCRTMSPVIDQMAPDFPNVTFAKVNVDDVPEIAKIFGIQSIPTFYMVKFSGDNSFELQKNAIGKIVGAVSPFDFKQAIEKLIEKAN